MCEKAISEAVAAERTRIAAAVRGADLPFGISLDYNRGYSAALAVVLDIIETP